VEGGRSAATAVVVSRDPGLDVRGGGGMRGGSVRPFSLAVYIIDE